LLTLKSPRFLYREITDAGQYDVASRLSFGLWNSLPDQVLLAAAASQELQTEQQIRQQAVRMLADDRARQKLYSFLLSWLQIDGQRSLDKDVGKYPGFDEVAIADLRSSLELFIAEVLDSEAADFRKLLSDDQVYLNPRLADLFEVERNDEQAGFLRTSLDPDVRAGVLTHPYLLAQFAYPAESSPIHRGVFVARTVLGLQLLPPPEAFAPLAPELHANLTTRERVTLQTGAPECMSCHQKINPLGFAFENFDAIGRYREQDRGKPVDSRVLFPLNDQRVKLANARELSEFVLNNRNAQEAFCEQLFHYLVGQSINAYGSDTKNRLCDFLVGNEFNIRLLAAEIMVVSVRRGRDTE